MPSKSGRSWANIRVQSDEKHLRNMAASIERAPEEFFVKNYYRHIQRIAFDARLLIIQIIEESETPTGERRVAKGAGRAGRIDTEEMLKAVWARIVKTGNKSYRMEVGWLEGKPGHAIFQEHGTRTGIKAMNSLNRAADFIEDEIRKLAAGGTGSRVNTDWDWNAPGPGGKSLGGIPDWLEKG